MKETTERVKNYHKRHNTVQFTVRKRAPCAAKKAVVWTAPRFVLLLCHIVQYLMVLSGIDTIEVFLSDRSDTGAGTTENQKNFSVLYRVSFHWEMHHTFK